MYSLVSAAVLACDLARHPSGVAVADVLDQALALTTLDHLGTPAAAQVRDRVQGSLVGAPRMSRLMDGVSATLRQGLPDRRTSATLLAALTETPLGGLEDLHRMLRRELTGTPGQVQVVLDAVTVAWVGRGADLHDLLALQRPWVDAVDPVPPALPLTAYSGELAVLLDAVARRTPQQWQRVADAHGAQRGTLRWSTLMHQACQAAWEGGLTRDVARAHLVAARALRLSGASTGPAAHAVAMATTAATQAIATAHLLDTSALLSAWEAGT